jgi:pimeloyl-ACP methyl ester carboxylesterase
MSKSCLILLPGQLCDSALWTAQVDALADIAEIRVADLTLDDTVEAMAARVLADAPARFAVCGLSLGGYVAFEIVRRAAERVTHLGLMNTSARPDTVDRSAERERSVRAARVGTFKGVTAHFLPSILHPAHAADTRMAELVLAMTERVGRVAFEKQQNAAILRPDCRPLLPAIRCPTLVVGGKEDQITPPMLQIEIATDIQDARLEILDPCGHLAPIEQAETVNRLMRAWLGSSA